MSIDFKENKDKNLKIRLTSEEYEFVKDKANVSCLSISEYSRRVLLEQIIPSFPEEVLIPDPKLRFNCDHDKEMMRFMLRAYLYTKTLLMNSMEKEEFMEYENFAKKQLQEWGYE